MSHLQRLQKKAAKIIMGKKENNVLRKLHWLPIDERINFKMLSLMHLSTLKESPVYLREMVDRYEPIRQLRSASQNKFNVPRYKILYGRNRPGVAAPKLWNDLPTALTSNGEYKSFRRKLKTHLFPK